jgi:hypothetical protein
MTTDYSISLPIIILDKYEIILTLYLSQLDIFQIRYKSLTKVSWFRF